jgi:hypothetical protein
MGKGGGGGLHSSQMYKLEIQIQIQIQIQISWVTFPCAVHSLIYVPPNGGKFKAICLIKSLNLWSINLL